MSKGREQVSLTDHEVERARTALVTMTRIRGLTLQDLDDRTGHQRGYFSQIFGGRLALRYRHIVEVLAAIEVDPNLFFRLLHPTDVERELNRDLLRLLIGDPGEAAPAPRGRRADPAKAPPKRRAPRRGKPKKPKDP